MVSPTVHYVDCFGGLCLVCNDAQKVKNGKEISIFLLYFRE